MNHSTTTLDRLDWIILRRLQEQGKLTNVQLAEEIGLSPASTLERVRKLEKRGVIQSYHARIAPAKVGLQTRIMLQVQLHPMTAPHVAHFQESIAHIPAVVACHQVVGNADFMLEIVAPDMAAYHHLIVHQIGAIDNIKLLNTLIITDTIKEAHLPIDQFNNQ